MPGAKGLSPHELVHRWVKDLRTRPDIRISWDDNDALYNRLWREIKSK